jgi:Cd2+/Zn2+-exporting ATPase
MRDIPKEICNFCLYLSEKKLYNTGKEDRGIKSTTGVKDMARHFAPTEKKKFKLPTLRLKALPSLFPKGNKQVRRRKYERVFSMQEMILTLAATLLFIVGLLFELPRWIGLIVFGLSAVLALLPALLNLLEDVLRHKMPNEDLLAVIGVILAFCIGEELNGAIAAILYRLMQILEAYALARGDTGLDQLRDKLPEKARLLVGEDTMELAPENVNPGQTVVVQPGEAIPLDGTIVSGVTELDLFALTGNHSPKTYGPGDEVFSGSINRGARISVEVSRSFGESAAASLLHEVQDAARYESQPERIGARISAWCGPILGLLALVLMVVLSLITGDWVRWLRCGTILLLLAAPSTIAISLPLACFGGELSGIASGILSKGHDCFEILASVKTMVFGKTGTITEGRFEITGLYPNGVSKEDLLSVAAAAESFSKHPVALLLKGAAGWTPEIGEGVMEVQETPGRGISAFIEGRHVYVGSAALLQEHGIHYTVPARAGTAIHVAVENRYWGHILLSDKTREGAFDAIESLRSMGVDQMVMLTGDVLSTSRPLASSLGFDLMRSELSPEAKVSAIEYLISGKGKGTSVGFVGDGINDVPMLECADVGIAIDALHAWKESDAADILLLDDEIGLLPTAMRIARSLRRILWGNLGFLAGVKLILVLLAVVGVLGIPAAAALNTFASALALLNSIRAFGLE